MGSQQEVYFDLQPKPKLPHALGPSAGESSRIRENSNQSEPSSHSGSSNFQSVPVFTQEQVKAQLEMDAEASQRERASEERLLVIDEQRKKLLADPASIIQQQMPALDFVKFNSISS